jgi:hypothetical protein
MRVRQLGTTAHDGPHTPGSSGEWVGRCTKCGQSC